MVWICISPYNLRITWIILKLSAPLLKCTLLIFIIILIFKIIDKLLKISVYYLRNCNCTSQIFTGHLRCEIVGCATCGLALVQSQVRKDGCQCGVHIFWAIVLVDPTPGIRTVFRWRRTVAKWFSAGIMNNAVDAVCWIVVCLRCWIIGECQVECWIYICRYARTRWISRTIQYYLN